MKRGVICWCVLLAMVSLLLGHRGGPDDYGYIFMDDEEGVEYNWINTTGATSVGLFDDDGDATITLPFPFTYYGETYTELNVSTNGFFAVMPIEVDAYTNAPMPTSDDPNGTIALYWNDGEVVEGESDILIKTVGTEPERKFVVTFLNHKIPLYTSESYLTYQMIIEEVTEGDNPIVFQYQDVECDPLEDYADDSYGRSATVGIEDATGNVGLTYLYDDSLLTSGRAVKFFVAPTVGHNVLVSEIELPVILLLDVPFDVGVKVSNIGENDEVDIPLYLEVYNPEDELIAERDTTISSLLADSSVVLNFAFDGFCLLYTSPSPRDLSTSRMPSSA